MYLLKDAEGDFTARQSEDLGSTYLGKIQYQSQDAADVDDDEGNVGGINPPQRGIPPIKDTGKAASSERKRRKSSMFET